MIETVTWNCGKCNRRFVREIIDLHIKDNGCIDPQEIEDLEFDGKYECWTNRDDWKFAGTTSERIEQLIQEAKMNTRTEYGSRRSTAPKRDISLLKKWLPLALERTIRENILRVKNMNIEDERRVEELIIRLQLLKSQLINFLEECDWETLDELAYIDDAEIAVRELMSELAFEWGCSVGYKG